MTPADGGAAGVTLYREIDALGGTANTDHERGYVAAIDDVLAILSRRGFSEATDAGAVPIAVDVSELRCRIQDALLASLGDVYDCTRVWSAWNVGTMDQDDFEPVLNRLDELVDEIAMQVTKPFSVVRP
ncbi:hypothetical protein [Sphingomonas sp. SAFR-052]|uniref:hypothetical protein n=1 Tax=Sphingomonas sp. SAFR-052 TaxID=3436867 RepID=UPI003F7CFD80